MFKLFLETISNNSLRILKILRGSDLFFPLQYLCPKITLGNKNASFTVNPRIISSKDIVYSFGIGTDISFDLQLIENFGVTIFAFDPTPKSIKWLEGQNLPNNFKAFQTGLAKYDGLADFYLPENENHVSASMVSKQSNSITRVNVKTLSTLMKELGHTSIDILKMDIEGAEYDVLDDILSQKIIIKQLLVEFHHRQKNISIRKTREALRKLNTAGFKVFHISRSGEEYSLFNTLI
jgi:FkbM family methyltransferase